ncbi:MAG: DUF6675 family protein [Sphaerochaetaceae bacterium]
MGKRIWLFSFVWCFSIGMLWADAPNIRTALPDLSEEQYQSLEAGEMLSEYALGGESLTKYFVKGSEAEKRAELATSIDDGFSVVAVSYIPYGKKLQALSKADRQLAIFNQFRAISTQEGLNYISWRAGNKPKLLIEKSSYMEDEKNLNNLLPDPIATEFPYSVQSYVYQRDTSFGGNRYLHTYTNSDDEIFVEIKNINTIRVLGIFTAVKKGQLTIHMGTYQLNDGLLLVAMTSIDGRDPVVSILGLEVDLPSAFRRRIVALQNWFKNQLDVLENQ